MNRDDLLKRCVDRRVAHETSVVAVSHLFYVYLLSALKKGQQVEVPNFGTFGTHVVGVKRQRRMPFFEVERELADKVNERYRNLKTLLVGHFEVTPVEGEVEYTGKEPRYGSPLEPETQDVVFESGREVPEGEYTATLPVEPQAAPPERLAETTPHEEVREEPLVPEKVQKEPPAREPEMAPPIKEKKLMPKLNLRGDEMDDETRPVGPEPPAPPPTLRDISGGEGPSPLLQIVLGLLILGAITFALNYFGVIHLWGKRAPVQQSTEESLPPVVQPPPETEESTTHGGAAPSESLAAKKEETPTPTPVPAPTVKEEKPAVPKVEPKVEPKKEVATVPPAGTGNYTVQVYSSPSKAEAEKVVQRLSSSGFDAYVAEGFVKGRTWYRVRVGRFPSSADAQAIAERLRSINENGVWITKVE
jgi:septal ring-binding cell division protein DamX